MNANEIAQIIRNAMETAKQMERVCRRADEDSREAYGWQCRVQECRELLNSIPGTPEAEALAAMAVRKGADL